MTTTTQLASPATKTEITRADLLDLADYQKIRSDQRKALVAVKKNRRVPIGPHATFYFESFQTMWFQIQEMLYIEKGGEAQIADELAAFNPLVPKGRELIATLMFEIDDENLRKQVLSNLGGVEETVTLSFAGHDILARPEDDVDRTNAAGKASSVQFLHFDFTDQQVEDFKTCEADIVLGIKHAGYPHMTLLQPATRKALAEDFT